MQEGLRVLPQRRIYPMDTLPNSQQITAARSDLQADREARRKLKRLEEAALLELEEKRKEVSKKIGGFHAERDILRANEAAALSFIAPIRRLPLEIYREIFLLATRSDDMGRTGWCISGVCRLWRKMALNIPHMWSYIRFRGTLATSPDIIRLWVERSGQNVELDIEIELLRRKRLVQLAGLSTSQKQVLMRQRGLRDRIMSLSGPISPSLLSAPPMSRGPEDDIQRNAAQWGHVVLFYLTAQKHRWRTFSFESLEISVEALQVLNGASLSKHPIRD